MKTQTEDTLYVPSWPTFLREHGPWDPSVVYLAVYSTDPNLAAFVLTHPDLHSAVESKLSFKTDPFFYSKEEDVFPRRKELATRLVVVKWRPNDREFVVYDTYRVGLNWVDDVYTCTVEEMGVRR